MGFVDFLQDAGLTGEFLLIIFGIINPVRVTAANDLSARLKPIAN